MMNCETARDLLPLYVGGDLLEARRRETEEHLQVCEACSRECEALLRCRERIQELSFASLSEKDESRIWKAVREEIPIRRSRVFRPLAFLRYAGLFLLGIAAGFGLVQGTRVAGQAPLPEPVARDRVSTQPWSPAQPANFSPERSGSPLQDRILVVSDDDLHRLLQQVLEENRRLRRAQVRDK